MSKEKDQVKIHIDNELRESPNPTTGAALYVLGPVNATEYDLYKKIPGKDDELIENDDQEIIVKNGDHFYGAQKNLNPGDGTRKS